jgi:mRNA interferase RelE/StbE
LAWTIEFDRRAVKDMDRLSPQARQRIQSFLNERVATAENPRSLGAALAGSRFGELWRYRVGDYRVICQIVDAKLLGLVLETGHRSKIYR